MLGSKQHRPGSHETICTMSLESKNEKNLTFSSKGFSDFRLRYKTGTNETVLQKFYILHETNHHFKEKKNNRSCLDFTYFRVLPGRDIRIGFGYKRHICLERVSMM